MDFLHSLLSQIVNVLILLFECVGVGILLWSGLTAFWQYLHKNPDTSLNLARGMAMALQFKLGGEILRTVVVQDFKEILTVAFVIALRAALAFLINWEIKNAENEALHRGFSADSRFH